MVGATPLAQSCGASRRGSRCKRASIVPDGHEGRSVVSKHFTTKCSLVCALTVFKTTARRPLRGLASIVLSPHLHVTLSLPFSKRGYNGVRSGRGSKSSAAADSPLYRESNFDLT